MQRAPDTHSLMNEVLDQENLIRAWKRVRANKGAPGIDGLRSTSSRRTFERRGQASWRQSAGASTPIPSDELTSRRRTGACGAWEYLRSWITSFNRPLSR